MPIPEPQLETWSAQGSAVEQSKNTYASIRNTLLAQGTKIEKYTFNVFLQGSYGNDTNIFSESDVDVVARLDDIYFHDTSQLSQQQLERFQSSFEPGTTSYNQFKLEVVTTLRSQYGNAVDGSGKAIAIPATGYRRNADVIAAAQFRKYYDTPNGPDYFQGIQFTTGDGREIVNYPILHSQNLTAKHQVTKNRLKPTIRIFKNIRRRLVEAGTIERSVAPSYFIEGLIYNVPNMLFAGRYHEIVQGILNWLYYNETSTNFVCANERYYLIRETPDLWSAENYRKYLSSVIDLWNNW